jgi:hypothetical protein
MRKNIFDLLQRDYDFNQEITKIDDLMDLRYELYTQTDRFYGSIEDFVDQYLLKKWKYRDTITSLSELREIMRISRIDIKLYKVI